MATMRVWFLAVLFTVGCGKSYQFSDTVNGSSAALVAQLNGTISDDGLPSAGQLSTRWELVSGPGEVAFEDATNPQTRASFTQPGRYILKLVASDGATQSEDEVVIEFR